jgi:hypothetical protein
LASARGAARRWAPASQSCWRSWRTEAQAVAPPRAGLGLARISTCYRGRWDTHHYGSACASCSLWAHGVVDAHIDMFIASVTYMANAPISRYPIWCDQSSLQLPPRPK